MAETEGEYEPTEETKETEDAAPYIGAKDVSTIYISSWVLGNIP